MKNDEISQKNRALFLLSPRIKRTFPQAFDMKIKYLRHYFWITLNIFDGQIQDISITTIIKLVRIFLQNQYCLYKNKLYQQIQDSSFTSPLTMLLANTYMYYWQQDLVEILTDKNEIFGR